MSRSHTGFTLIEVTIGLFLSMVIMYAALVAFRATSSAITIANRNFIENSLLRSGLRQLYKTADAETLNTALTQPNMFLLPSQIPHATALTVSDMLYGNGPQNWPVVGFERQPYDQSTSTKDEGTITTFHPLTGSTRTIRILITATTGYLPPTDPATSTSETTLRPSP